MKEVDKFCTDDSRQFVYYRNVGYFQDVPPNNADLGELVCMMKPGRESAEEQRIACSLGLAPLAPMIYHRVEELGIYS